MVLVLLGLSAAFVLPSLRLPARSTEPASAIERARAVAVRRGEAVRLQFDSRGAWTVRATADTTGATLLSGTVPTASGEAVAQSVVISALGACLPEGQSVVGASAWDPTRCAAARH